MPVEYGDWFTPGWQKFEYWPQETMANLAAVGANSNDMAALARAFPPPTNGYTESPPLPGPMTGYGWVSAPGQHPSQGAFSSEMPAGYQPPGPGAPMSGSWGGGAWGDPSGGYGKGGPLGAAGTPGAFTPNPQGIYSGDVEGGGSPPTQTPQTSELGTPDPLSAPAPSSELGTPTTIDVPSATSDNLAGGGGFPGLSDSLAASQFGGSLSDAGLMRNLIAALLTNRGGGGGGGSPWGGGGGVGGLFGGSSGLGGKLGI